ncbi:spore germination protein [Domibacillus indicus]|uniref:spore germination protein n=1 Tax=Domibacillus indicus TaxID=1437523 RepID=UPI0009E5F8CD
MASFFKRRKKSIQISKNEEPGSGQEKKKEETGPMQAGKSEESSAGKSGEASQKQPDALYTSLAANLDKIKRKTGNSPDVVIRPIKVGGAQAELETAVVYVKGLVDDQSIHDFLIESLMNNAELQKELSPEKAMKTIKDDVVAIGGIKSVKKWDDLFADLMSGNALILIDGSEEALMASTQGGQRRSVQEPTTNVAIRGSKESFTESLETNQAMVRRIINNPDLWVESMNLGKMTKTSVSIMYINGIAKKEIVDEVRTRLKQIDIDSILESGYIEQLIEDQTMTTFPTVYHTERPDAVAGNLLEGRVAVFVNGTPFVLLAPAVFIQFFQSVEDYYARFDISTAIRFLRVLIFFISLVGPAVYIAATTFHQEMIPTALAIIVAAQRESSPFPAFVEAIIMEVTFEILREAGLRLPKAIGATVSIVGGLVVGQAAVQAGIVSPAMLIVVAITAIASFATPSYAIAISARLIRFLFMVSAAMFGFYGLILALIMLIVHLCSLRSFGIPYMSPLAPVIPSELGDTIVRKPLWAFGKRPQLIAAENRTREGKNQKPKPPESRGMKHYTRKEEKDET